jgi:hypothetical protein
MHLGDGESQGFGGAFLKTLSICVERCVVRYPEFERIRVETNRASWEQTPRSDHGGAFPIL